MFEHILATLLGIGAIIVLLMVMIVIAYWRKGTKYAAMERVYRERQAEASLNEAMRRNNPLVNWDIHEDDREGPVDLQAWQLQAALDDPPRR